MSKTQNQGNKTCDEVLIYTHCMEKELEYWLKEKKISYMEKALRSMEISTRFAGTMPVDNLDMCWNSDIMDIMYEEDEDLVYDIVDSTDFEDEEVIAA